MAMMGAPPGDACVRGVPLSVRRQCATRSGLVTSSLGGGQPGGECARGMIEGCAASGSCCCKLMQNEDPKVGDNLKGDSEGWEGQYRPRPTWALENMA